jgi:hypothetical protein
VRPCELTRTFPRSVVSLALELRAAQAAAPSEPPEHRAELAHIAEGLANALGELCEIALGIHPAILAEAACAQQPVPEPGDDTRARQIELPPTAKRLSADWKQAA